MRWDSGRIQNWQLDPTEVEGVSRCPDDRAQSAVASVEQPHGRRNAVRITKPGTCCWLRGQFHVVARYVFIHQIQERVVGRVPKSDTLAEIVGKFQNSPTPGAQSAKKGDPLFDENTKIDGMTAVGTGDE